jgi:hypothetical protein
VEDENYNVMILRAKNITKTIILKKKLIWAKIRDGKSIESSYLLFKGDFVKKKKLFKGDYIMI